MRWRPLLARCGLVLAGVLAPLALLEVALRLIDAPVEIFNPLHGFNVGDARLGWKGQPDVDRRFRKLTFDTLVQHDADGFRRPDPAPSESATRHVLVLGDSYAWGWGVSQGELMTDWLQRTAGPSVAVHNRGVNAFATAQEYLLLQDELERRRYATVILLFCVNDFGDNVDGKEHRPRFELRDGRLVPVNLPLPTRLQSALEEWLDDHSRVSSFLGYQLALLKARWRSRPAYDENVQPPSASEAYDARTLPGADVTRALLLAMADAARRAGAELVVVYVPAPEDVRAALGGTYVDAAHGALEAITRDGGIRFVDLAPRFRERATAGEHLFIPQDGHWSAAGQRLAAQVLAESVLETPSPR